MNEGPKGYPLVPSLEEVRTLFERWRATRPYRCPIPDHLWQAAISLAPSYPLSKISTALRLNYSDLKKRVDAFSCCNENELADDVSFVELPLGMKGMGSAGHTGPYPCTVEMEKPSGERMSCAFYESVPDGLVYLVEVFVTHKP